MRSVAVPIRSKNVTEIKLLKSRGQISVKTGTRTVD